TVCHPSSVLEAFRLMSNPPKPSESHHSELNFRNLQKQHALYCNQCEHLILPTHGLKRICCNPFPVQQQQQHHNHHYHHCYPAIPPALSCLLPFSVLQLTSSSSRSGLLARTRPSCQRGLGGLATSNRVRTQSTHQCGLEGLASSNLARTQP